jgi:hypothetical protein
MKHSILLTPLLLLSGSLAACGSDGGEDDNTGGTGGTTGGTGGTAVGGGGTTGGTGGSVGGGGSGGSPTVEFCDAPAMVFTQQEDAPGGGCLGASCHVTANVEAFPPDLESADPATRLFNLDSPGAYCTGGEDPGKYINSADGDASLLITKISTSPVCGVEMPFNYPSGTLSAEKAECISKWVHWVIANQ